MKMDATQNAGPMAGVRMDMSEQCLYTVKNGKIAEAKFFYSMG
jgi:predicted ester cyclase